MTYQRQAVWEKGLQVFQLAQRLGWPGSDDQGREKGNLGRAMPAPEDGKGVGAHEAKQNTAGR
jgi:hypothetical protein